jgi:mannose-6-phosphate isomerase-like protein (cupin superfamily)
VLVVESGAADIEMAGQSFRAGRGALVHVPARTAMRVHNGGASALRLAFVQIK